MYLCTVDILYYALETHVCMMCMHCILFYCKGKKHEISTSSVEGKRLKAPDSRYSLFSGYSLTQLKKQLCTLYLMQNYFTHTA